MENLLKFKCEEVLAINETEKILYLLGRVEGAEGEAIAILTPKLYDHNHLHFSNVQTIFVNDIYARFTAELASAVSVQFIYPINEKLKNKYRVKEASIRFETGEDYANKEEETLKRELAHIQWVNNIIEGKSEAERVVFKCPDYLIVPDFKYTDLKETKKLHLMALFSHPKLHSIRDLTGEHAPLLESVRATIEQVLEEQFGVSYSSVRVYFHYPPTFYRLHIHIMHLSL
jgi:m7GpppX diphosphatase